MSLIKRKDHKWYMAMLLPSETWQEDAGTRMGDDWLVEECDSIAWMIKHKGKKYVIGTNQGSPYFMAKDDLQKKVFEYKQAIVHTNKAISEVEC